MDLNRSSNVGRRLPAAMVLAVLIALAPNKLAAQDVHITGPLAGAHACRNCRIYREGRIQLQPFAGFTLQDEFSRTILFGAQAMYHVTDWLGIGVWGGFGGVHIDTGLTDQVSLRGQTTDRNRVSLPSRGGFTEQIGEISWMVAGQVAFIPLRGKLALFQKLFIDSDFYIFGGVAAAGLDERADLTESSNPSNAVCIGASTDVGTCAQTQGNRTSRVAIAPTFGVGLMLYATGFFGLSVEWRAVPFAWNTSGTDEDGPNGFPDQQIDSDDHIFHLNHMVNVGLAFYLPAKPDVSE